MAYERIEAPKGSLYHYTKTDRLEEILKDGRIRRFKDRECWFCTSLVDTLRLMEMTVMKEGHPYVDTQGRMRKYPAFVPEDYVILRMEPRYQNRDWVRWNQELPPGCSAELLAQAKEFSALKKGFRGDLKFYQNPQVHVYKKLLAAAKAKGEVRADLDVDMAAFFLDNIVVMLQFSLASSYYRSRIKLYLGEDYAQDRKRIIAGLMRIVKRSFS